MKRRALISGITGQDGSYLTELLLEKDYEVYGIIRRASTNNTENISHILDDINLEYGDVTDYNSIERIMKYSKPDEIYNLAAQSHVGISFENPVYTTSVTGIGALNIMEAFRNCVPYSRFYQAGSSEMFGNSINSNDFLDEQTPFNPASPYACAKVFAHNIGCNYRRAYNLFISNGILFNHESPRRGDNFVTQKVITAAYKIFLKQQEKLYLGNITSKRDWGHAKDYVKGMWLMLQHNKPDDFILASGVTYSIETLCDIAFSEFHMDYKDYVIIDNKYKRPEDVRYLKGNARKAGKELGWKRDYNFKFLIKDMLASLVMKDVKE